MIKQNLKHMIKQAYSIHVLSSLKFNKDSLNILWEILHEKSGNRPAFRNIEKNSFNNWKLNKQNVASNRLFMVVIEI